MTNGNLFDGLSAGGAEEVFATLAEAGGARIERIVSHGHVSPEGFWYDQPHREWVVVLRGAAKIRFEDGVEEMGPGDFVDIQPHKRHRVEWTTPDGPTIWLAVHFSDEKEAPFP